MRILTLLVAMVLAASPSNAEQTFSETQKWDAKFESLIGLESVFKIDWAAIELPRPPDSEAESQYLVELQTKRTPEIIRTIKLENDDALDAGEYLEPDIGMIAKHDNTKRLCEILRHELVCAVLPQKKRFDRVRPSFVNPEILTVVANPGHPSYPSGHASQYTLTAYCLAAANPDKAKEYIAKAAEITRNREYAGLHYPSDSYIGKILAKVMIRKLLDQPGFQAVFLAASEEWPGAKPTDKMIALRAYSLPDPRPVEP